MKKILFIATIASLALSCVKDMDDDTNVNVEENVVKEFVTTSEEVKSVLDPEHKVLWVQDDQINVFNANENKAFTATDSGAETAFTGEISALEEGQYFYAIYPYAETNTCVNGVISTSLPATQYATPNTYPEGTNITVASSQTNELNFKNVCGLLQMTISRTDISKIELKADEGQYFAGDIDVTVSAEPTVSVKNGLSVLTILPKEGDAIAAGTYYFPVIPQTYTNLQITFTNTSGKVAVKCSDYPNVVERSSGLDMKTIDASLGWADEVKGIFTGADFIQFAKDVNADDDKKALSKWASEDGVVYIHKNIDLGGKSQIIWTYKGVLDGNGKTISNYVMSGNSTNVALIADNYGTIRNLNLDNTCSFTQTRNNAELYVGSLVGKLESGAKVINCSSSANVIANTANGSTQIRIGGIVGWAVPGAEISSSTFNGTLSVTAPAGGDLVAGGIVGFVNHGEDGVNISNCKNSADISLIELQAGKPVRLGGIVGICRAPGSEISQCVNCGDLTVTSDGTNSCVGGICGYLDIWDQYSSYDELVISESENIGIVTFNSSVDNDKDRLCGGIVGKQSLNTQLSSCTNRGAVTNASKSLPYVGGIVGRSNSLIYNCKNYGTVTVTDAYTTRMSHVGGIVGYLDDPNEDAEAIECENHGKIICNGTSSGSIGVAGVAGRLVRGTVDGCTNRGEIFSTKSGAGSVVGWMLKLEGVTVESTIKNCKVGGSISTDGGTTKTTITADNYSKYIYGGKPSSGVTAVVEGNTFAE